VNLFLIPKMNQEPLKMGIVIFSFKRFLFYFNDTKSNENNCLYGNNNILNLKELAFGLTRTTFIINTFTNLMRCG